MIKFNYSQSSGAAIAVDISCLVLLVVLFAFTRYKKLYEETWTGTLSFKICLSVE